MGTNQEKKDEIIQEIRNIQNDIIKVLGEIGWSRRRFAERVFYEDKDIYCHDNDKDLNKFIEKFKKDLNRRSSTESKLMEIRRYQDILYDLDEVKQIKKILPKNILKGQLGPEVSSGMKAISRIIDCFFKKNEEAK